MFFCHVLGWPALSRTRSGARFLQQLFADGSLQMRPETYPKTRLRECF